MLRRGGADGGGVAGVNPRTFENRGGQTPEIWIFRYIFIEVYIFCISNIFK